MIEKLNEKHAFLMISNDEEIVCLQQKLKVFKDEPVECVEPQPIIRFEEMQTKYQQLFAADHPFIIPECSEEQQEVMLPFMMKDYAKHIESCELVAPYALWPGTLVDHYIHKLSLQYYQADLEKRKHIVQEEIENLKTKIEQSEIQVDTLQEKAEDLSSGIDNLLKTSGVTVEMGITNLLQSKVVQEQEQLKLDQEEMSKKQLQLKKICTKSTKIAKAFEKRHLL